MSTLAERQLAAWEQVAAGWLAEVDGRVARCHVCGKGMYLLADPAGNPYRYAEAETLAHTVLHLRNHHPDLDPDRHG